MIRLKPKTSIPDRLVELEIELEDLITEHKPDICAVEQLYSHYKHPRTAILMGHARSDPAGRAATWRPSRTIRRQPDQAVADRSWTCQ